MKRQKTITNLMTIIFSVTILVQIVVLLSVIYIGKIPEKIKKESYYNFDKNVQESLNSLENIFNKRIFIQPHIDKIYIELTNHFGSLENVKTSSKDKQLSFIKSTADHLLGLIDYTESSGAYLILNTSQSEFNGIIENDGLYFTVNEDWVQRSARYEARIISEEINLDETNVSIKRDYSKFNIDLKESNNKYYSELNNVRNYGLFNNYKPFVTHRYQEFLGDEVINVSFPIYDFKIGLVAVIGIEFDVSDFFSIVPSNPDITYVLGYTDTHSFRVNPVLNWEGSEKYISNKYIYIENLPTIDKYYKLEKMDNIALSLNRLSFYDDNRNPYNNDSWVFLALTDVDNLLGNTRYVENVIFIIIFISLAFGALMICLITEKVTKPIKLFSHQVTTGNSYNLNVIKNSNIEEVNNLLLAFERLNHGVIEYSNKLTNAINTFLLGLYFYQNNDSDVYCTQPFLDMCGSNLVEGYISREEFEELYNKIVNSYYDEKFEAYQLSSERWIKLDTKIEKNFTLGIVTDITDKVIEIRKVEEKLDIDGLTQIYNRLGFQKLASEIIEANPDKTIAIIMWDIDKLKYINDRYGHETGDRYIMKFAETIKALEKYNGVVGRRSGDEFFGIIIGDDKSDVAKALSEVRYRINNTTLNISHDASEKLRASVGIAWYPENGTDLRELLDYADQKLYQFKFEFGGISNIINTDLESRMNLYHFNKELAKVIDGDYVTFAYQPIVSAKTGEIFGYEMLMRIFSDILNNPTKLIEIAKENQRLSHVEELTFTRGFESYQMNKSNIKNRKIFINSIANEKLADRAYDEILEITNNNLDMLVVELMGLVNADTETVFEKVKKLRSLNASIAVDNFKLEFIDKINFNIQPDIIKVDISVINDIDTSSEQQKALINIVKFARANNYKVVAVGIKRYEELEVVINSGVDYLQGYYIAEPTVKPSNISQEVIDRIKELQK